MSRIFIENLPKNINQKELEKIFSQKGEITDIQLKKEKKNAFIGYKYPEQAEKAVKYFNRTFILTSRISVKIADGFRLTKSQSSDQSSKLTNKNTEISKKIDPFEEVKDDPAFKDFLRLQRNIESNKDKEIWKDKVSADKTSINDEDNNDNESENMEDGEEEKNVQEKRTKQTFEFTVKIKGLPYKIKKNQLKEFLKPIKPISMRFVPKIKGIAYVSFKNLSDLNQAMIKHRGFIDGHRIEIIKMNSEDNNTQKNGDILKENNENNEECNGQSKNKWENQESMPEPISETGRIYIRNLSYTCKEEDLRQLFEKYGPITELHMPIDFFTKKLKGFAFVTFVFPEHAIQAFNELDKTDFQGRLIHLIPAHNKKESYNGPPLEEDGDQSGSNIIRSSSKKSQFKQNKLEETKNSANNSINWNTLFVRPSAVADIMSKNLNMNKTDLLTKSDKKSNAAIRMALGEVQIVNEIKQFLIKNNVHLKSFERGVDCPRSSTVILVKNLPSDTTKDEIEQLFRKCGLINRVILPPYGLTAIVEMQEPNEAKFAFKKLAYANFKHYPLYLEWAPEDVFTENPEPTNDHQDTENNKEETMPIEDSSSIFVKNLNFQTTEEDFRQHFDSIGPIHSATIAKKKTPKGLLSMGYGFVQFYQAKHAKEAIKRLQNSSLDDHKIEIKLSNRTPQTKTKNVINKIFNESKNVSTKQNGSKICVKNIPFEATIEDVKKIFSTYGQLKSVRIPKKLTGSSQFRGFGFVDFVTKQDAKRAFDALSSSTHLYGRHLVLEWAKDDQSNNDDDEIRQVGAKTARYFNDSNNNKRHRGAVLKRNDLLSDLKRSSSSSMANDGRRQQDGLVNVDEDDDDKDD